MHETHHPPSFSFHTPHTLFSGSCPDVYPPPPTTTTTRPTLHPSLPPSLPSSQSLKLKDLHTEALMTNCSFLVVFDEDDGGLCSVPDRPQLTFHLIAWATYQPARLVVVVVAAVVVVVVVVVVAVVVVVGVVWPVLVVA